MSPSQERPRPPFDEETIADPSKAQIDIPFLRDTSTWNMCPRKYRGQLIAIWALCWANTPSGSWEADDELIAMTIGLPLEEFLAAKKILLKGWREHADGRLYHPYITTLVERSVRLRDQNRARSKAYRVRQSNGIQAPAPVQEPETIERPKLDRVPFQAIVDLYHEHLKNNPKVVQLNETRKGYIRRLWKEELDSLDKWESFFKYVNGLPFLTGKQDGGKWIPNLEWLTKPSNYLKIKERNYER